MNRFMKSLTRVSEQITHESDDVRNTEYTLDDNFESLKSTVRKSLLTKPQLQGTKTEYAHPPKVDNRKRHTKVASSLILRKDANPYRNFSLPAKPTQAAKRIYRSPATIEMYERVIEGYNDYLQHPSKIGILEYESQIDPYLHVGAFDKDEVSKTATGALTGKYTFY